MRKEKFAAVREATEARIERGILPGAALRVTQGGVTAYEYAGGHADIEAGKKLRGDEIFRLCSMTKPITAAAVLLQQDRGLLDVHDEVRKYLPAFARRYVGRCAAGGVEAVCPAAREMTIEDLLTHGSGLGSGEAGDRQFAEIDLSTHATPSSRLGAYAKFLLDFSPGERQAYSALVALDLAVCIVEKTSGQEYETFLRREILDPLDMRDTGYALPPEKAARLVTMYRLRDDRGGLERQEIPSGHEGFPAGCVSGSTCMTGTLDDYCRFAQMLCDEGRAADGRQILSPQAVRAMRTPHYPSGFCDMGDFFNWGYTVRVRSGYFPDQTLTPGSYGWSGAYNTHFWVDPARKLTAVYMSNMDNAGGAGAETAFEFERTVMCSLAKGE